LVGTALGRFFQHFAIEDEDLGQIGSNEDRFVGQVREPSGSFLMGGG
jgi:hypothetical protein